MEAILLNGTVGAGKTTAAEAISSLETRPHALFDVDWLRRLHPAPAGDPFQREVAVANIRDVARNYRDAGAERFVLAGVVESREERERYRAALGTADLLVVRLVVRPDVAEGRLRTRHAEDPDVLSWHLARAPQLAAILDSAGVDDLVLDASDLAPRALAQQVRAAAGW